jgi:peptidoglycan hydrolase-like protein with peptidoglycan-binding domain
MKKEGETVTFKNKDGQTITGTVGKNGEVITEDGSIYTDVEMDAYGNYSSGQTSADAAAERDKRAAEEAERNKKGSGKIASLPSSTRLSASQVKNLQSGLNELLADGELTGFSKLSVDGSYGNLTKAAVKKL